MITVISKNIKSFSQKSYDELLENINLHEISCSCHIKGNFIKHGHYNRSIKVDGKSIILNIQRLFCKSCKKTHALLPKDIVPYSQISIQDHILIIKAHLCDDSYEDIMINNEFINENTIAYIINKYKNIWNQMLLSLNLSMKSDFYNLIFKCLNEFKRQFMQIKNTVNIYFIKPT